MKRIIIVDYGVGNILSISRAIQEVGYKSWDESKNQAYKLFLGAKFN